MAKRKKVVISVEEICKGELKEVPYPEGIDWKNTALRGFYSTETEIPLDRIMVVINTGREIQLYFGYDENIVKTIRDFRRKGLNLRFDKTRRTGAVWKLKVENQEEAVEFLKAVCRFPCVVFVDSNEERAVACIDNSYEIITLSYPFVLSEPVEIKPKEIIQQAEEETGRKAIYGYLLSKKENGKVGFTNVKKLPDVVYWNLPLVCIRLNYDASQRILLYSVIEKSQVFNQLHPVFSYWRKDSLTRRQYREFVEWSIYSGLPFFSERKQKITVPEIFYPVNPEQFSLFKKRINDILAEKGFAQGCFVGVEGINFPFLDSSVVDNYDRERVYGYTFDPEVYREYEERWLAVRHNSPFVIGIPASSYPYLLNNQDKLKEMVLHELAHHLLFVVRDDLKEAGVSEGKLKLFLEIHNELHGKLFSRALEMLRDYSYQETYEMVREEVIRKIEKVS